MKDYCYVIYIQNRYEIFIELVVIPEEKDSDTIRKIKDNFYSIPMVLEKLPEKDDLCLGRLRDDFYYISRKDLI